MKPTLPKHLLKLFKAQVNGVVANYIVSKSMYNCRTPELYFRRSRWDDLPIFALLICSRPCNTRFLFPLKDVHFPFLPNVTTCFRTGI